MKKSLYPGQPVLDALDARGGEEGGAMVTLSGLINSVFDRYTTIVASAMPTFSVNEWALIFDSLNGVWLQDPASIAVQSVAFNIADSIQLNQLDQKWEVDGSALVSRLRALSSAEATAIIDATERFWGGSGGNNVGSLREQIASAVGEAHLAES